MGNNMPRAKQIRVRANAARGGATDAARDALLDLLVENYTSTKELFDALDDEGKEAFREGLGDLADGFEMDGMMVQLGVNDMEEEEMETIVEKLNALLDERAPADE